MNKKLVLRILGIILACEAVCLIAPMTIAFIADGGDGPAFVLTIALCGGLALILRRINVEGERMHTRDGFAAVALGWLVLSLFGALPYFLAGCCSYVDAFFETVSGFTTTGASIFSAPAELPRGIQFWRALTQWMGGMGVLVLLLALLPKLGEGSVNLMKAESPGPIATKLLPRTNDTAKVLYTIYICLTAAEAVLLRIAGMPWFDAVTTSFTTISTGGFSVRNESIAYYGSEPICWIINFFMFVSAINFSLLFLFFFKRSFKEVFKSEELRTYTAIVVSAVLSIALCLVWVEGRGGYESISLATFQVLSLMSTTGYATADYSVWPHFAQVVLILVMFVGGCAGSTAGGIKVSRLVLLTKNLRRDLRRIIHPRELRPILFEGQRVEETTLASTSLFLFAYMVIILLCTAVVSLDNVDFITSFSSALTMISNVGPGFGAVGPLFNFSPLSNLSKVVLTFTMLFGRLEIFPLLVMLFPSMWKKR